MLVARAVLIPLGTITTTILKIVVIVLLSASSIRSGANKRPATAREATVPWLNESRCAR